MRFIIAGFAIVVGLYLVVLALMYSFQRSLLYFPDQAVLGEAEISQTGFAAVTVDVDEIGNLTSLWRPPVDPEKPVIIHFHGNGGSVYGRIPIYQDMAIDGAGVLAVGYPGYGGNRGKPAERYFHLAAKDNYQWLLDQGFEPGQIVIIGQSIGSGSATRLAANYDAAGLILEAPFTGTDDVAAKQFPFLPVRWLMKDKFRNINIIDDINMPLVWIHGTADEVIDYDFGQQLYDKARNPKRAYPVASGYHNDLWSRGIGDIIRAEIPRLVAGYEPKTGQSSVTR